MSLPIQPAIRLLLCAILITALAGCRPVDTITDDGSGPRQWVVLGDGGTHPGTERLAAALAGTNGDLATTPLDLTSAGAGLESLITRQLPRLSAGWKGGVVLALGPADARGAIPLSAARYSQLINALLETLRGRGAVTVTTIPPSVGLPVPREERLQLARTLRHILEQNAAIRAAAARHGAQVLEQDPGVQGSIGTAGSASPPPRAALGASVALGLGANRRNDSLSGWFQGFDDGTSDALRQRAAAALVNGQRLEVVAKLGDSITSSPAFLTQVTEVGLRNSPHARLGATLHYFSQVLVPNGNGVPTGGGAASLVSPLVRRSLGSDDRWYVTDVLDGGGDSPLTRELESIRPGVAVVMFGTNDLTLATVEEFEEQLNMLLEELERRLVIPIVSTIPARLDQPQFGERVPSFNAAIQAMATVHQVPLVDYAAAMATLPNGGLSDDGIHPSVCPSGAGSLSAECLRYGYNLRNLLTLLALERLQLAVLDNPLDRLATQAETGQ